MARTLNAGTHRLVFTAGVNDRIADDSEFAKHVYASLLRFNRGDWGDTDAGDWAQNDATVEALNSPDRSTYGLLMGAYTAAGERLWITRQVTDADGGQSITVLFPSEY